MLNLTIIYFAHLRDQRGCDREQLATRATTPAQLYDELSVHHRLSLSRRSVVVAINDVLSRWESPLHDGDTVVFLPPVSGG